MSWQTSEKVYVVMWKSPRTGATLSDIRKTEEGRDRLLRTLQYLGYDLEADVVVSEQTKAFKPITKKGKKEKGKNKKGLMTVGKVNLNA